MNARIAFFASSLVSTWWNGAATYYRGIVRHLHELGYRVRFYEPDALDRQAHRDLGDPPWAEVVVYPAGSEDDVARAIESARDCDVLVKASGVGVHDAFLEREVLAAGGGQRTTVFWDVGAPATLQRLRDDPHDPLRTLVPRYDLVFTYGGGDRVVRGYRELGAKACVPVYNALDPSTHHPVAWSPKYNGALGLLANRLPDREARIAEFFLKPAAALPRQRFLLGGSGWERDFAALDNVAALGHVPSRLHNAFHCGPLAVLSVNRACMAAVGFTPATRVFEAAGAAACLITDHWDGIDAFLEPEREVLVARSGDEVAELLADLTPARARKIGTAARRRLLAQHTYAQRAAQVDRILQSGVPA